MEMVLCLKDQSTIDFILNTTETSDIFKET